MKKRLENLKNSLRDNEVIYISSYPNIFYYSGFTSSDARLIITHQNQFILTDSRYTIQAKEQASDFEIADISKDYDGIFKKLGDVLIGYEGESLTVNELKKLEKSLCDNQSVKDMQHIINAPRKIKSDSEIKKIAEAERIGDEAFSYILPKIHEGVSEIELALELEFFMKRAGASTLSFETIVASGARSAMPHGVASKKCIEKGDFVTFDFGCVFEGYCSDMTRTVVMGKASEWQKEIYNVVLSAQQEALNVIEAGKKCSDIDQIARDIIAHAGYDKNFGHGLGHSVGIEIHEMPSLSPKCDDIIQNGHILTVEPGIYIEGKGGVRIEDLVAIQQGQAINLTKSEKTLIEII